MLKKWQKPQDRFGEPDPQTGFFPVQWNSWQTTWTGTETTTRDGGTRTVRSNVTG